MKQMPAGAFKARCLAVMKKVQMTGEPVIVTKRGAPVVKVVPVRIVGDIESPIPVEWEVTKK